MKPLPYKLLPIDTIFIFFVLIGIFPFTLLPFLTGLGNLTLYVYLYRVICIILGAIIIFKNFHRKKLNFTALLPFGVLFSLLIIRMIYDLYILDNEYKKSSIAYVFSFLGICIFPFISILYIRIKDISFKNLFVWTFISYMLFAIINIAFLEYDNFPNLPNRTSSISKIWAIAFGQAGVTLAILSMFFTEFYKNRLKKYIATIGYFIGVFIVVLSASKGPFLTLILLTILYFLLKGKKASLNFYLFYILLLLFSIWIIYSDNIALFSRLKNSIILEDASTDERIYLLKLSIERFLNNIWLGDYFLITTDRVYSSYPHNLFLEAFLNTGMLGGCIFIYIMLTSLKKSIFMMKKDKYLWINFIFIQYFIQSLFSASIYTSYFLWGLLALIYILYTDNRNAYNI